MGLWGLFGGGFQKHRRRGDEYRARGELGFAKAEYEAALRAARGRGEEEIAELKGALAEMRRELSRVQRSKGDTLREDGFFDEAQDAYHLALELCEGEGDREAVLAALRGLEKARREEASRQPELAPEGDEFLGESLEERFEIFLMGIEDPEVVQAYREQGPDFARILLKLQEGAADEAIPAFEALLAKGEDHPLLHLELGRALLFAGDEEASQRAADHLRVWVDTHTDDHEACTALGEALRQAGCAGDATALLRRVAAQAPPDSMAIQNLAEHHLLLEEFDDAAAAAQRGMVHRPRSLELKKLLGLALHGLGKEAEAAGLLEVVLRERWRYDPETGEVELDRGTAWALARIYLADRSLGEDERARNLLQTLEADAEEPERPLILASLGEVLIRLGELEEARRRLETALALLEDDVELRDRVRGLLGGL